MSSKQFEELMQSIRGLGDEIGRNHIEANANMRELREDIDVRLDVMQKDVDYLKSIAHTHSYDDDCSGGTHG